MDRALKLAFESTDAEILALTESGSLGGCMKKEGEEKEQEQERRMPRF